MSHWLYGSSETGEVFVDQLDGLVDVPRNGLDLHVASHHPPVGHLLKLYSPRSMNSESLFQQSHDLPAGLHVGRVVFSRQEEGGTPDLSGQFEIVSTDHLLHSQGGVWTCNGDELVIFGCQFEGLPHSPAETGCKKLLYSLGLQIHSHLLKILTHNCLVLPLDILHDRLAQVFVVWRHQHLRKVHVVVETGEDVSNTLVPAAVDPKNIGKDNQRVRAFAHVVDWHAADRQQLALGVVVGLQLLPRTLWTATHIKKMYLSIKTTMKYYQIASLQAVGRNNANLQVYERNKALRSISEVIAQSQALSQRLNRFRVLREEQNFINRSQTPKKSISQEHFKKTYNLLQQYLWGSIPNGHFFYMKNNRSTQCKCLYLTTPDPNPA